MSHDILSPKQIFAAMSSKSDITLKEQTVCLHYLRTMDHYVVSQSSPDGHWIHLYDSEPNEIHLRETVAELEEQLKILYHQSDRVKICCPQSSDPYEDTGLYALVTLQVLSQGGDPCLVKFKRGEVVQRLRNMNHGSFQNLPTTLLTQKPKQSATCPWKQYLYEFNNLIEDDYQDLEETFNFGNFTTMVTHKELLTQLDVETELKAQEMIKAKNEHFHGKSGKNRRVIKKSMKTVKKKTVVAPSELEARDILSVAPSEGEFPRDPSADLMGVIMAFPGVYGGRPRSTPIKKVTLHKIIKFELRHKEGRVAKNHELIFAMTRQSYLKQLCDMEQISLRKVINPSGDKYVAKEVLDHSDRILKFNEGYRFLKTLRGSPPYFEKVKKNVFAMMRYHGQPTFFTTFSAAEHQWTELLQQLGLEVDKRLYSEKEIYEMPAKEKQRLILARADICARHFNNRTNILFKDFLKSPNGPLGEVKEFFYRVEFQKRGSPHLHCLLWVKDAPIYDKTLQNEKEVCAFVDKYISCSRGFPSHFEKMIDLDKQAKLIEFQTHRHSRTCPQKSRVCRFNFPKPPMDETTLLTPFDKVTSETAPEIRNQIKKHKENFKKIDKALNNWSDVPNGHLINSLPAFLKHMGMTKQQYIDAVRTSISIDTIFLKRLVDERWINGYNPRCLATWQANMDCQYVTNGYAAASYILDYVTKGERGMSELLRAASKEAAFKELKQNESLKLVSKKFIDFIETGAQEAIYFLLGLPLYNSSNAVVYIPTSENPARLLKPMAEIAQMEDDDEEIAVRNGVDKYQDRPCSLGSICLAEFYAYYNFSAEGCFLKKKIVNEEGFLPEQETEQVDDDLMPEDLPSTETKNGLKRRTKPRIIRYVNYNVEIEPEEHYRELLMLFYPFRSLENLKQGCESFKERYLEVKEEVDAQRDIYTKHRDIFDRLENLETLPESDDENQVMNELAPSNLQQVGDNLILQKEAELSLPKVKPVPGYEKVKVYHHDDEWSDQYYHEQAAKLNKQQFQFVHEFLHMIKKPQPHKQLHWFLSGGAGVGKTTAVNVLYEAVRRYYNSLPNIDHSKVRIIKCAFTGKASHQIKGFTIHHLFKICFATNTEDHLTSQKLAALKELMSELKVLIVDEVSMVENGIFTTIDQRLRSIKEDSQTPFGGVHVLVVGDLFQLPPVNGRMIWEMGKPKLKNRIKRKFLSEENKNKGYVPIGQEFTGSPLAPNIWELFEFYELQTIMRQKDEKQWAEWLNRLRECQLSPEDRNYIMDRVIPKDHEIINDANYITLTNAKCHEINHKWFLMAPVSQRKVVQAIDVPHPNQVISEATILMNIETVQQKDIQNLFKELELAIGHEYDFVINLDTLDGITNGTPCILKYYQENSSKGDLVWVDPQDDRVGKLWRQNLLSLYAEGNQIIDRHLYQDGIPRSWMPIPRHVLRHASLHFTRKQFPIRPSKARTVNRTQGATLEKIAIDFSDTRKGTEHCHYVAFSRCPKKDNVYILGEEGLAEKKITHNAKCIKEMNRLRKFCQLSISLPCLFDIQNEYSSILFLNAQSVRSKIRTLENDWNVKGSAIFGIADTRFEPSREMKMAGFSASECYNSNPSHPSLGIAVYNKIENNFFECKQIGNGTNDKASIVAMSYPNFPISGEVCDILVSFLYVLPNATDDIYVQMANFYKDLINKFKCKFVIMGDFNRPPSKLHKCFQSKLGMNVVQKINVPTHNQGGTIDLIFTNIKEANCGILDSLTKTDHRPIFISIPKS